MSIIFCLFALECIVYVGIVFGLFTDISKCLDTVFILLGSQKPLV